MKLSGSATKVAGELARRGIGGQVAELPDSTRSAAEAARALGCDVAQIAKSLVFRGRESDAPVLVVASGADRVDEEKLAAVLGEPVERASADYVRAHTGFAVGGVPPVGHDQPVRTYLDEALFAYDRMWAAAGTPRAVFPTTPGELRDAADAAVVAVASRGS